MRLVNELTVTENVMLSFAKQNGENWWNVFFPNSKVRTEQEHNLNRVKEILETCFISEVAENKASEISYGQQKLLNLACCIANDANVLLLDEPVAGVNLVYRDRLTHIINDLKEQGKAILIIEHNTDFIEQVADEILFLNNGLIAKFNDYNSLRHDPEVKEAYI
jgi:ABC-type branched-subunit amino acid transport system ATPase component